MYSEYQNEPYSNKYSPWCTHWIRRCNWLHRCCLYCLYWCNALRWCSSVSDSSSLGRETPLWNGCDTIVLSASRWHSQFHSSEAARSKMYNVALSPARETIWSVLLIFECLNPLDAGRRLTDFSQTSYAAGSRLTYKTVNQRSGS